MLTSKHIHFSIFFILSLVILSTSVGCGDSESGEDVVPGQPNTYVISPPPGLSLSLYSSGIEGCYLEIRDPYMISLDVSNSSGNSITYSLSAGVRFIPNSPEAQTMMLLQPYTITIEAGTTETFCLPVYSLNEDLHDPDYADYDFSFGSIATSPCLSEILVLSTEKMIDAWEAWEIQRVIWFCLERGYIHDIDRNLLQTF